MLLIHRLPAGEHRAQGEGGGDQRVVFLAIREGVGERAVGLLLVEQGLGEVVRPVARALAQQGEGVGGGRGVVEVVGVAQDLAVVVERAGVVLGVEMLEEPVACGGDARVALWDLAPQQGSQAVGGGRS